MSHLRSPLALAFRQGPGVEANQLIHEARAEAKAAFGSAVNYEVLLDGKGWSHVREVLAPRLAMFLKEKRLGVADCAPAFLSLFQGDQLYLVRAADFFEHYRLREGLVTEAFSALAGTWERTGKPTAGALPGGTTLPGGGSLEE